MVYLPDSEKGIFVKIEQGLLFKRLFGLRGIAAVQDKGIEKDEYISKL